MSFYKYQSAIGDEKQKEKLIFVYMVYYRLRSMVCGGDVSVSLKRKIARASSIYRCFSILQTHKDGTI